MRLDPALLDQIVGKVIEAAMDQFPWDAGYRADFYRAIASDLTQLADHLEDENDYERGPCAGT